MHNSVARLRPRTASYDVAAKAFLSGDFVFSIESSVDVDAGVGLSLRARSLFRVGRYEEALAATHAIDVDDLSHAYAGELLVLRAMALHALNDPTWEAVATEARARAFSSGFIPLECEVEFVTATLSWADGRVSDAEQAIDRVLDLTGSAPGYLGTLRADYLFNAPYWRARAYGLQSAIDAGREDYLAQAGSLKNYFAEFDRAAIADIYGEALNLHNLAVLIRDLDCPQLADFVESRSERVAFNEFTTNFEHEIFHALASNRMRRGDHLGALRYLRRAQACAPTLPQQIMAIVDRSMLARDLGETFTALDDLEYAVRLSKQVDWERTLAHHRLALANLARLLAPIDLNTARTMWNRYSDLKTETGKYSLAARGDRRMHAMEIYAHAGVLVAEGNKSRAISLLSEALEIWSDVGYSWRAANIALELAELTGERYYHFIAQREADKYPHSLLAKRAMALELPAPV